MSGFNICKPIPIEHNVYIRVVDQATGQVVSQHTGHNTATFTMLEGIARYLRGDGALTQTPILKRFLPSYMSVGTMGVVDPHPNADEVPTQIGTSKYNIGDTITNANDLHLIGKDSAYTIQSSDTDIIDIFCMQNYVETVPGFGADGSSHSNNTRQQAGLGAKVNPDLVTAYFAGTTDTYPVGELTSDSFRRSAITYRNIEDAGAEVPDTIDVIYGCMISTNMLKQFMGGQDYIYLTEVGLWSRPDYIDNVVGNGLLAAYRITPMSEYKTAMGPGDVTQADIDEYAEEHGVSPSSVTTDDVATANRAELKKQILRVNANQVVQVIWKLQLGITGTLVKYLPGPTPSIHWDVWPNLS